MLRFLVVVLLLALLAAGIENGNENSTETKDPNAREIWEPLVGQQFQIVLSATVDADRRHGAVVPEYVQIFDIDLFDNTINTIRDLKRMGKKVICYFSAGTSETWRPDFKEFQAKHQGAALPMWPGEKWLDIREPAILRIMRARIRYASQKGCDAVDPDNMGMYDYRAEVVHRRSCRCRWI
jgi:hypothetical protein